MANQASEKSLEKSQGKKKKILEQNNTLILTIPWLAVNCCKWVYQPFPWRLGECCHHKAVKLWHKSVLYRPVMTGLLWGSHRYLGKVTLHTRGGWPGKFAHSGAWSGAHQTSWTDWAGLWRLGYMGERKAKNLKYGFISLVTNSLELSMDWFSEFK